VYKPVDGGVSFPKLEEDILNFWQEQHIFERSVAQRAGGDEFVFYDGPPFATGLPHFGHFVPSTIKDIIPRYQTMRGKHVERRFGWDCHGLPVENLIEKELHLNSKTDIETYGIAAFNEACRAAVLRYVQEWRHIITRLGRWVDFDHDYKTMDSDYMESIWWVMQSLWRKELLYEGHYILPYCPRCSTVLANHELNLGGYRDVSDPAISIRFKICSEPHSYFLAWTTTPWTLPSNMALTLGPDIEYALVEDKAGAERYILAVERLNAYYKDPTDYRIIWTKKGKDLSGIEYEPLFPYFAWAREQHAFRTYIGDFVTTTDGTGIVHTAPGFGEDDARVLKGTGIPVICPVDAECRFTEEVPDYCGRFVKDTDKAIIERLKYEKKIIKHEQIIHAYPHCWRCDSPLIYRAVSSWFVNVEHIKKDILACNEHITWVPEHIKHGRFGKWLEGARDWAISRNRYWGNPLPIWKCPVCKKVICIGSKQELKECSGVELSDLHKHFVDPILIPCECGGMMKRIPEVLDCWFESGAMPYAQNHYPFEHKEFFEHHFPADFINEGLDQTRGWFYTLTILAAALFNKPAFHHCIVSGLVLASDGKKMSKKMQNYTDPLEVINSFGADALRLFLTHSSVVKADDLKYSDEGVKEVLKSIIIPLWNAYSFFVTYANIDHIMPEQAPEHPTNLLDQWILSVAETLVENVQRAFDAYDLSHAIDSILDFIDQLNNWYIRRSRRRFWRSENDNDKLEGYASLYAALKTFITVAAPVMPFITETIWHNIRTDTDPISVHLADFPYVHNSRRNSGLESNMALVQRVIALGRALRSQYAIKVRQPLQTVEIITRDPGEKAVLLTMEAIIREELNVKDVRFRDNEADLVRYEIKANFRILGKEFGKSMKKAAQIIESFDDTQIQDILNGKTTPLTVDGITVHLNTESVSIRRIERSAFKVLNDRSITVALDSTISPALAEEGDVRDLIRGIQNLRKEQGFAVSDRINISLSGAESLKRSWEHFKELVATETLAAQMVWTEPTDTMTVLESGEKTWFVALTRLDVPLKNPH
jgi:isoleucyl-tRNA synthetase